MEALLQGMARDMKGLEVAVNTMQQVVAVMDKKTQCLLEEWTHEKADAIATRRQVNPLVQVEELIRRAHDLLAKYNKEKSKFPAAGNLLTRFMNWLH